MPQKVNRKLILLIEKDIRKKLVSKERSKIGSQFCELIV